MSFAVYKCLVCNETFVVLYGFCRAQCTNCGKWVILDPSKCKGHCEFILDCIASQSAQLLFTAPTKPLLYKRLEGMETK